MLLAVLVLPSPGTELVTTKTFIRLSTSTNWRFVRRIRNASTRGEWGARSVSSGCFGALLSKRMPPSTGVSVMLLMS